MNAPLPHPDDLTTAAYLDGGLPEPARDAFEAHLAACDECRAGVVLLRVPAEEESAPVPPAWVARARRPGLQSGAAPYRPILWASALAATVALGAAVLLWAPAPRVTVSDPPRYRSTPGSTLLPLEPAAGASLPAAGIRFRWTAVAAAERYRVTVRDGTGEEIAVFEVAAPACEVEWRGDPPAPGTLLWKVEALRLGRAIAETRPTAFEVRR